MRYDLDALLLLPHPMLPGEVPVFAASLQTWEPGGGAWLCLHSVLVAPRSSAGLRWSVLEHGCSPCGDALRVMESYRGFSLRCYFLTVSGFVRLLAAAAFCSLQFGDQVWPV